ncbi:DUF2971 domain-containing protein [Duganella sp. HH105]|uniref:DUF2971 domain-containing protein n=1 Tax=Duganella sp. HH105 TaxID=1781067 RepID=UPI000892FC60|nr:DUF2971 domain-containing protein [Duganella sp. HH105]OEZ55663.1 hypothetical protein DUGA6_53170 [Duganella sp. HH105]
MRLYKYYGFESGLAAIKSEKYGFRRPTNFNDPFELSFLSNSRGGATEETPLSALIDNFGKSVVILSLTRTPKNPLMWAHYGQEHKGFVIGYDVNDIFLKSYAYNVVPVDDGEVVYTNTKNKNIFGSTSMQRIRDSYLSIMGDPDSEVDYEARSFLRKIFLTKHASWVYEEEVRVVKVLDSMFDESVNFQSDPLRKYTSLVKENNEGKTVEIIPGLFLFDHTASIKSIYLGVRNPLLIRSNDYQAEIDLIKQKSKKRNWKLWQLSMSQSSWALNSEEISVQKLEK